MTIKKAKIVRIICKVIIFCLVLSLLSCISVRIRPGKIGKGFVSVSFFEKIKLMGVDRIVLCDEGKNVEITNLFLVKRVVWSCDVATHPLTKTTAMGAKAGTINLYNGDKLVRSMRFEWNGWVELYESDATHILYAVNLIDGSYHEDVGYVKLSLRLITRLRTIFDKA